MNNINKELSKKSIAIKGHNYVLVKDRVLAFNELYSNGMIQTELISPYDADIIVIKATVTPDVSNPTRAFVDYSQAVKGQGMINTTSAMENASTSATGRALAMMGIGVIESFASADEMNKAITQTPQEPQEPLIKRVTTEGIFCMTCKAPAKQQIGTNKLGKPYNAIFCSTKDMTHTKWL